jgi:dihydropyrimidinase
VAAVPAGPATALTTHFDLVVRGATLVGSGLTSANAARLFGLHPRKGVIAVGSDADLVLWDPQQRRTVDGARMQSRADYSVYDGWQVQGWPRFVIRRGQILLADGESTASPGQGQWLRRSAAGG